ncbi:hypothetical protein [Alloactinosynnema sp. L-07]|nr:hypothetical protein [Alloactinosynnema sp. L-07]
MVIADHLDLRWQSAYSAYRRASGDVAIVERSDPDMARAMAVASWEVAVAWREIADAPGLP